MVNPETYCPSDAEWWSAKQMIKVVKRGTRNNLYTNGLVKDMQDAINRKDYKKYRIAMDEIQIYYARVAGKTLKEIKDIMKKGKENLMKKFQRKQEVKV